MNMKVTPAQAYDAMMKAADFIEANPDKYNFMSIYIPESEYDCLGCMIGWFGYFLQQNSGFKIEVDAWGERYNGIYVAEDAAAISAIELYRVTYDSCSLPKHAVKKMRFFAEKHWGHAKNDAKALDKMPPSKYDWQKLIQDLSTGPSLLETTEIN